MISAILSFLGGSAFRMVWGEVSAFFKAKQEHAQEQERMKLQAQLEQVRHTRNMEMMTRQHELGIKQIQVQSDAEVNEEEARAFTAAMRNAMKPTGIVWVDAWNASVRPAFATICLALWALKLYQQDWIMQDFDMHLVAVIVGFFFADRSLRKVGR